MWTRRHLAAIFIVLAGLLGASGCVSVPTAGPIDKVEGQQLPCQNCVNVEVAPPALGDKPKQIVEGYLRATSNYQPNYSVAKQFLTRMAAEKWSPETGVSIYRGLPTAVGPAKVKLSGTLVGALLSDRTYVAQDQPLNAQFELVKDKEQHGEWRINSLPGGLMVDEFYFARFYQTYDLYFVGNGTSLVPDPIYLPVLRNPANVASALMKALLNGPSSWLKPAVSTAVPSNTTLSVDSVTITDGIAEVPLSDAVLALPDPQRGLLAAQIVYTLKQVSGVKGVSIKVNQQPYRVPGADPNSLVVSVDAIPPDVGPIPSIPADQLYAVKSGAVQQVTTTTDPPTVAKLPGSLGTAVYPVNELAVSVTNTDFAVTTNGGRMLRRAPIAAGEQPITLLTGATELLRPQFSRYGEIWEIGQQGGRQRMWMFTPDNNKPHPVTSPVLQGVKAFKISPDGTRMALVRRSESGSGSELGLARIIRSDNKIMVDGWRPLDTTRTNLPRIGTIADVGWLDDTELLVLGAADANNAFSPFRVAEDASVITQQGDPENWDAFEIAVLPGTQSAVIVGHAGTGPAQAWKYNGSQWLPFVPNISTLAYPG